MLAVTISESWRLIYQRILEKMKKIQKFAKYVWLIDDSSSSQLRSL